LPVLDWSLGSQIPAFVMSAAHVDNSSKSGSCGISTRDAPRASKTETDQISVLFTGDESWMFYAYDHRTMWVVSWDDVVKSERPSHFQEKTIFTICSMELVTIELSLVQKDKRWIANFS
jgi:hypothetical protein